MQTQKKLHPQQAVSAFMVIFFHAFIIGFVIQWLVPLFWIDDLSSKTNLLNFAIFSSLYSFILAFLSSIKIYKTGFLQFKYILHITLYSVFFIVLAQTVYSFSFLEPEKLTSTNIHNFIRNFALSLITVIIMAFISWKIWEKWRTIKSYD